jgi:hypothetical protein
MGGGREAMANDTHGVDVRKNREAPVCQKKVKKIEVTWNFGESPPTIVMIELHTGLYVPGLRYGKMVKPTVHFTYFPNISLN